MFVAILGLRGLQMVFLRRLFRGGRSVRGGGGKRAGGWAALAAGCVAVLTGCVWQRPRAEILSNDPAARVEGITAAAVRHERRFIPLLIDRLDDRDRAVRFAAIGALRQLTDGKVDFGYRYFDPPSRRYGSVQKWRRWWSQNFADGRGGNGGVDVGGGVR